MSQSQTYSNYAPSAAPLGGLFAADVHAPAPAAPVIDDSVFDDIDEDETPEVAAETAAAPEPDAEPQTGVSLWPHQEAAVKAVLNEFRQKVDSTLVVSATGSGKSVMIGELARFADERDHGVLILVHRDELIRQLVGSCGRMGVAALVEKASEYALDGFGTVSKVVVASVQTLRGKRLAQWDRKAFRLCIIDEAHHSAAASYQTVIDHFGHGQGLRVAGFTATADRLDGKNIGSVFESLAYEYNIADATRDGFLVPIEAIQLETNPPIDLKDLRVTAGDLNAGDLERVVNDNIGVLVNTLLESNALEDRRTIAFTPNISSAVALAQALTDVGISAISVAGNDPDRAARIKAHKSGQFQVLVNCQLATEGYDDREISAVLLCRPTKSRSLYSQMVGRGTRIHPESGKRNCRVVDFAFVTGKHKLVSPVDLYDNSETPEEVVEIAREIMADGRTNSIDEALDIAHEQYDNERRVRIQKRAVQFKASKFDPLTACEIYGVAPQSAYGFGDDIAPSDKQIAALEKMDISTNGMSRAVASKLLTKLSARREHGWASPWQVKDLIKNGVDVAVATGMRAEAARAQLHEMNSAIPATSGQLYVLQSKYDYTPGGAMTKAEASAMLGKFKREMGE